MKKPKKYNVVTAYFKLLPIVFKTAPLFFLLLGAVMVLQGSSFGLVTVVTQRFFDAAAALAEGTAGMGNSVFWLALLGLCHIANQLLDAGGWFGLENYMFHTGAKFSLNVHKKMSRLAPVCFEDTELLDDINKAEEGKKNAVDLITAMLKVFTFYASYFVFMSVYLYRIKPVLVLSLIAVFIPTIATLVIRSRLSAKAEDEIAPLRRRVDYYESCTTAREYYKETRLLGSFHYFNRLFTESICLINKSFRRLNVKRWMLELLAKVFSMAGYFGILFMLVTSLINGEISAGAFAAVFMSIGVMFSMMNELIFWQFGDIAQYFGTVQNYLRFMDMPERKGADIELPNDADIELENVSFAYPGGEKKAVANVTLSIKSGETVAIVGENGSGKSTLVRLITGLYLPDEGETLHGGINTKTVSMPSFFKKTSAVFQKYQRYQMTLRDNIGISKVDETKDDASIDGISAQAGIDKNAENLPDGYETMLSREFDGVDLSGGQWQRVAIARSFFREHGLIVLDEPTAAIDPIEETRIYNRFAEISKGKTAIIVTHRLGSVRLADRIFVMKDGNLTEQGSHEELVTAGGEYTRLYKSQEQWYN